MEIRLLVDLDTGRIKRASVVQNDRSFDDINLTTKTVELEVVVSRRSKFKITRQRLSNLTAVDEISNPADPKDGSRLNDSVPNEIVDSPVSVLNRGTILQFDAAYCRVVDDAIVFNNRIRHQPLGCRAGDPKISA